MRLVEFALQGVRRFEGGRKVALEEGYNLVTGPNESGKTTCLLALLATLEPERLEGGGVPLLPEPAGAGALPPPRCGIVFVHDGRSYRLVRDLVRGAATLGALDVASGKYVTQERDPDSIRRWLHETVGMPGRRAFDTLFVLERAGMPSAALGALTRGAAGPAAVASTVPDAGQGNGLPGIGLAASASVGATAATREARVAELRAELARLEEMGKLEFRLDGAKAKLFEIDAEFGDLRKLDAMADELDGAIAEFERLGLPPDQLESRARGFRALVERRETELAAVDAEREALSARAAAPVTPILRDRRVLGGAAAVLVFLAVGVLYPLASLVALAGLGAAGFGALRDSQAAAKRREAEAGLAALDDRVQTIEKRFDIETRALRTAQDALGVSGPEGVLDRVGAYRTVRARRQTVAERRDALSRDKDFESLEAERARVAAEVGRLEEELRGYGASAAFDPGELRRELAALEGSAAPVGASAARPLSPAGPDREDRVGSGAPAAPDAGTGAGGGPLAAALQAWLDAAARLLGEDRDDLGRAVLQKAQALVGPVTADGHRSLAFGDAGLLVAVGADGRSRPAADLSPSTQDALYLALRLAGFTLVARERRWPLFLDDPLLALDDARLAGACRAIRAAARAGGQVLHLAARKLPPVLADAAVTLA